MNGQIVKNPDHWVDLERDRVTLDGKPLQKTAKTYLLLYKPNSTTESDTPIRRSAVAPPRSIRLRAMRSMACSPSMTSSTTTIRRKAANGTACGTSDSLGKEPSITASRLSRLSRNFHYDFLLQGTHSAI